MRTPYENDGRAGTDFEDDGHVIADMSGIERQPLLIPRFGSRSSGKRRNLMPDAGMSEGAAPPPADVSVEERRAMIRGSVAAGLLVAGVIAGVFAAVILLIGHV